MEVKVIKSKFLCCVIVTFLFLLPGISLSDIGTNEDVVARIAQLNIFEESQREYFLGCEMIEAEVINRNVSSQERFFGGISINKGSKDGLKRVISFVQIRD